MGLFSGIGDALKDVAGLSTFGLSNAFLGGDNPFKSGERTDTQTSSNVNYFAPELSFLTGEQKAEYDQGVKSFFPGTTVAPLPDFALNAANQFGNLPNDPAVQAGLGNLLQGFQGTSNLAQGATAGANAATAGTPAFLQALQQMGLSPQTGSGALAGGLVDPTQQAVQQQLTDPAQNQFLQQMLQQQQQDFTRNLTENILPQISNSAVASGTLGGSRQGIAQGKAIEGTQNALARSSNDLINAAYNRQLTAAGLGGNLVGQGDQVNQGQQNLGLGASQLGSGLTNQALQANQGLIDQAGQGLNIPTSLLNAMIGGGNIVRGAEQDQITGERERFQFEQQANQERINQLANIIFGAAGTGGGTTTNSQQVPTPSLFGQIAGLAGSLAPVAGAIFGGPPGAAAGAAISQGTGALSGFGL